MILRAACVCGSLVGCGMLTVCVCVQLDPKRGDVDRAINALQTGLSECGYQKA